MDSSKIRYKTNYLSKVIVRLDFNPILVLQKETPADFQDKIRSILPYFEEQNVIQHTTRFQSDVREDETRPIKNWIFNDRETRERYKIILNYQFFTIEDYDYTTLEDFLEVIELVENSFYTSYENVVYSRLGLRYINEINLPKGNPFQWDGFISPSLFAGIKAIEPKDTISRAMSQIVFTKETHSIVFNYGMFNSEFPSPIARKEFILDYDASTKEISRDKLKESVQLFNEDIVEMFESHIGDSLRDKMGRIQT